jgi:hypothetical protein
MFEIAMIVLALVAAAAVVLLLVAARKPDAFVIQRSASIAAAPEAIFPLISNLRNHRQWSPFDQDPDGKRVYSGPDSGKGAALDFDAGRKNGVGRLEVLDAANPSRITMRLLMTKPMACDHVVEFTLQRNGTGTDVTWAIRGRQPFFGKLMSTFIDCDKMCGGQFEKGLASLKAIAEGARQAA